MPVDVKVFITEEDGFLQVCFINIFIISYEILGKINDMMFKNGGLLLMQITST